MKEKQYTMESDSELENVDIKIDFSKIIQNIWDIRIKILKVVGLGFLIGLIISLSIPKRYSVIVTLSPEISTNPSNSGLANMAASFLGGGIAARGNETLSANLVPHIVCSTPFLLEMLDCQLASNSADSPITLSDYLQGEKQPWWSYVIKFPGKMIAFMKSLLVDEVQLSKGNAVSNAIFLNNEEYDLINLLKSKIILEVDKKNSIINLGITLQDSFVAAFVTEQLVDKLQKYFINYKISKATEDLKYWTKVYEKDRENYFDTQKRYAEYVDANTNVILQSFLVEKERLQNEMLLAYQVYSQVSQQVQLAQAKVQEAKPDFVILEPSVVPRHASNTSKLLLIIYSIVGSTLLYLGYYFINKWLLKFKETIN